MSVLGVTVQQPLDRLDWDVHYDEWLVTDGTNKDTIESADINILPAGGTLNVTHVVYGGDTIKLWIQGGEHDEEYTIEVTATTAAGRIKQDEVLVQIQDYV